jgi:hypothetical protein
MTSSPPRARRLGAPLLLAAVVVGLGLAAASVVAPGRAAAAAAPLYACVNRGDYSLREPIPCTRLETVIRLDDNRHPVWVCQKPGSGAIIYAGNAATPIPTRCLGASSAQYFRLPGDAATTFCVSDATGALTLPPCGPGQTPLVVPPRNTPPVAADTSATVLEHASVAVALSATDVDGQALTFAIAQGPAHGALSAITGTSCTSTVPSSCTASVTYTPAADSFGPDAFTYVANDGLADSNPATVAVTVTQVNDAPSFTSGGNVSVLEDSGAYSQPWAANVSAGPNEGSQTVTFHVANDDHALFATQPAIAADGTLSFTPNADADGAATVSVYLTDNGGTANGGVDTSPTQTFTLTVAFVNDAPSFTLRANPDQTVLEDSGPHTVANFVTGFSPGPPNESGQALDHYPIANDNNALFAVQPHIDNSGTLTYTLNADTFGTATVRVRAKDNGGTANGGQDTSPAQTFTITVTPVNDAPSFASGGNVTVLEESGAYSQAWATAISPGGPEESGQTVAFHVTGNTNAALFSAGPAVAGDGTLTFTPAANAFGSADITVTLSDNGGTANGGVDASAPQTFTITLTQVNDAPSFTSGGNVTVLEDSGASSQAWATGISPGPNEGGQTVAFHVTGNTNAALFSVGPAVSPTGVLGFTLADKTTGSATITVDLQDDGGTANGGVDTSGTQTFTVTVTPVNDAPSFTSGGNVTVLEESGAYAAAWATNISPGGPEESGQTVDFLVTNDTNPSLFSAGPAVSPTGVLTFTPAANAFGTAAIDVKIHDDGGTAHGGVDTSAAQTFTITLTQVNDAPSFTAGGNQTVLEDAGPQTVNPWATAISAGPNEGGQTLTFHVTNNTNPSLFSAGPAVAGDGTLTYTTAANAFGSATVTLDLQDDGGTANGGVDTSGTQTFTVTVTPVNDAPTFASGGDVFVPQSNTPQTIDPWATNISPGPNEGSQTVHFQITNDTNPGLFTVLPAVSPTGALTFTPTGVSGSADITLVLVDDGGTANGGVDTSAPVTFTIFVNSPPTITSIADQTIDENAATGALAFTVGDLEDGPNSLVVTASSDNPTLVPPATAYSFTGFGTANRTVTVTPAVDTFGTAHVTVTVTDSGGATGTATFLLTVRPVAHPPSVTSATTLEDTQTTSGLVVGRNALDGPEVTHFKITAITNGTLYQHDGTTPIADGAFITVAQGTAGLRFTPAANLFSPGTAFSFVVQGATDASGSGLSTGTTATITVTQVNDAPSFTLPSTTTSSAEHAGAQSVATFATAISAGPNEGSQTVHFNVTNDTNTALFSAGPALAADGTLTYTEAPDKVGNATITVDLQDDGGTAHGGVDTSPTQTFTITITPVNDPPVATDHGYAAQANMKISIPATSGLLAGATDPDAGDPGFTLVLTVDSASIGATSPAGGTVSNLNTGTGAFDFTPPPGATGAVTFTYKVCDNGNPLPSLCSAAKTVTFTVAGPVIWFVDPTAASNGNGELGSPFNTLSSVTGVDAADQRVFVYAGTAGGGIALKSGEWLVGQGVTGFADFDHLMGITPPTGTVARPTIGSGTATLQNTLTLNTNAVVKAVTLSTGTNTGLTDPAGAITGVDVSQTTVTTTTGQALLLSDVAGTLSFAGVSANGAATGVGLTTVSASVTISGGTIQNTTTAAITLDGSTGDFGFGGNISVSAGRALVVQNKTGGTNTFSGGITATGGTGIFLTSDTTTTNFSGAISLSTGANAAFTATSAGLLSATATTSVLTTTTGTALTVSSTTIGASGLTFLSISSNGAASGIVLNTTGSSGGLTVTGNGGSSSDHSGGQILASTGPGVSLNSTASVNLGYLDITNGLDDGIHGESVSGFTLNHSNVTANGNSTSDDGIQLGLESGSTVGVTGAVSITNSAVSGNAHNNVHIRNTSGTISSFTVTNSSFNDLNDTFGANGFLFEASGTSTVTSASLTGVTVQNNWPQRGMEIQAHDTATISNFTVSGSTFKDNGIQISFTQDTSSNLDFNLLNNVMTNNPALAAGSTLQAINVFSSSTTTGGTITGEISGNTIGQSGVVGSGSSGGPGIRIAIQGKTDTTFKIDSNTIQGIGGSTGSRGMDIQYLGPTATGLGITSFNDVTITNNTVFSAPASTSPLAAIYVAADNQGSPVQVRADIHGNTVPATGSFDYPTFDGNGAQIAYSKPVAGSTAQLVNTTASGSASAQLSSGNTKSGGGAPNVYADPGVTLIAGPINSPP